jgi:glycosyltransferase involved in cell wall biosynthesis
VLTPRPRVALFVADTVTASAHLRALQFIPLLVRDGVAVHVCATRPSTYLPRPTWLRHGSLPLRAYQAVGLMLVVAQRLWQIAVVVPHVDAVLLQKRLLFRPRTGALERLLLAVARRHGVRVILDVDDAVHLGSSTGPHQRMYRVMMAVAARVDLVQVGSAALAADFAPHARQVHLAPTCLVLAAPPARTRRPDGTVRLVWTGSPVNAGHLHLAVEAVRELGRAMPVRLEIVSRLVDLPLLDLDGIDVLFTSFSPDREVAALLDSDIGLAPLTSTPWTAAKCGGRLLAYFAASLPVVASPVGAQATMVRDGETGLWASSPQEWSAALHRLAPDPDLRRTLGSAGRRHLETDLDAASRYPGWRNQLLGG